MKTIPEKFYETLEKFGEKPALSRKISGAYKSISYSELKNQINWFSSGLLELGLKKSDRIILISENRPEWVIADISMLKIGVVNVPIFVNSSPEDLEYVINHSGAEFLIVSGGETLNKISAVQGKLDKVKSVISMEESKFEKIESRLLEDVITLGKENYDKNKAVLDDLFSQVKVDDTASIIYTSGTTGKPKGVMLSHKNFMSNVETCSKRFDLTGMDASLSFLPLCHVLERTAGYYTVFFYGVTIHYAESVESVPENLKEVMPDIVVSVPRLYEKMHGRVLDAVESGSAVKKFLFGWAIKTGQAFFNNILKNTPQPGLLALKMKIASALVFNKLKARLGGRLKFFISGGAPLNKTIAEFFGAAGIFIYEGYGLTETSPVIAANCEGRIRLGTVGTPLENSEVKIAEDGEILFKGPGVMKGYFKDDKATAEVIGEDGWLHTGDIGELEDGYLKITDRKKDIIVTANGKNVPPQIVENTLKLDAFITEAAVFGDKKSFLVGLIVPDHEKLRQWAEEQGVSAVDDEKLVKNIQVIEYMKQRIEDCQHELSNYSRIKKFKLMPEEFSIDNSEITPSLKLRRRKIGEINSGLIKEMYDG